jgi:hypothetical protein
LGFFALILSFDKFIVLSGRDPFKRAQKYVAKNNIQEATYTTNSKGGVFVQWGKISPEGEVQIIGKQFNRNFGDRIASFFSNSWNGFKKLDESAEGGKDGAFTGKIDKQDVKVGLGVVSIFTGAMAVLEGAAVLGGFSILGGINDAGTNSEMESVVQKNITNPDAKKTAGSIENAASIITGGFGIKSFLKNPEKTQDVIGGATSIISGTIGFSEQNKNKENDGQ